MDDVINIIPGGAAHLGNNAVRDKLWHKLDEISTPKQPKKDNSEAGIVLSKWNELYQTKYKSSVAILDNLSYWRESYSLDDILHAVKNVQFDDYWKDKMTPVILLRRKNPRGERVDNIAQLLNIAEPELFYTPEEQKAVDIAKEQMREMGLL